MLKLHTFFLISLLIGYSNVYGANTGDHAGLALESTRIIYTGDAKKGINFEITNKTPWVYLLQSQILPFTASPNDNLNVQARDNTNESQSSVPFIALPPLVRVASQEKITLRILLTNKTLPQDRESIFRLSLKAIPAQSTPGNTSIENDLKIVLALQNNIKLFYRPEKLAPMNDTQRMAAVTFSQRGTDLVIKNPTPYYITIKNVSIDKKPVNVEHQKMLPPFSETVYRNPTTKGKMVSWQLINDKGLLTPLKTQPLI